MEAPVLLKYKELALFIKSAKSNHSSGLKRKLRSLYNKENFKPEVKSMIENLQDELYQLENKQPKLLNFVLISNGSQRAKNAQKSCSKYLKDRICKIKQYLNYIVVIRQKSQSQNGRYKKTKRAKFSEKQTFITPTYAYVQASIRGGDKCLIFRKYGVLCFLATSVLRLALLLYYRRYTDYNKLKYSSNLKYIFKSVKTFMKNSILRRQLPKLLLLNF